MEQNIKFETQFEICYNEINFRSYDFYLSEFNLLIEADGDYWHSNPSKYQNKILTEVQEINIQNDKFKNKLAKKFGYNLIRFWETDIKKKNFKFKLYNEIKNMEMKKIKIKKIIPMCFSSSLIQQNFGESIKSHGYLIWDVETRTYIEKDVENRYGFYQFKIKSLDELEEGTETLTNG